MFSNIASEKITYSTGAVTKAYGNPMTFPKVALSTKPLKHANLSKPSSIL